jgi:hypothetical protein
MSDEQDPKYTGYVAAYDAAQRLSARLAAETLETDRQAGVYAAQGRALYQIKELARAGFLLLPDATDEQFEQLWHTAFQLEGPEQKGGKK